MVCRDYNVQNKTRDSSVVNRLFIAPKKIKNKKKNKKRNYLFYIKLAFDTPFPNNAVDWLFGVRDRSAYLLRAILLYFVQKVRFKMNSVF